MKELDSKAWRAFHKIGTSLLPHLGRQITNHSGISGAEYVVLVSLSELTEQSVNLNRLATGLGWEISRMSHQISRMEANGLVRKQKIKMIHVALKSLLPLKEERLLTQQYLCSPRRLIIALAKC